MSKTLRYEYPDKEFAGTFIEFTAAWKRRELRAWVKSGGDDFVTLLQQKTKAVNLDGIITDPSQFSEETLDELDIRLFEWFAQITSRLYLEVSQLGEASGRLAWPISETTETQAEAAPPDPLTS